MKIVPTRGLLGAIGRPDRIKLVLERVTDLNEEAGGRRMMAVPEDEGDVLMTRAGSHGVQALGAGRLVGRGSGGDDGLIDCENPRAGNPEAEKLADGLTAWSLEEFSVRVLEYGMGYALLCITEDRLLAARDLLGVRPMHVGIGKGITGVSTRIETLLRAGVFERIEPLPPGAALQADTGSVELHSYGNIQEVTHRSNQIGEEDELLRLLDASVRRRVEGNSEVAIAFSGGVDSSLLALLASRYSRVTLVSVSAEGGGDLEWTAECADRLGLESVQVRPSEEEIRRVIAELRRTLGTNSMNLAIGAAFRLLAEKCRERGLGNLILGQLADELYGGYEKYLRALRTSDQASAREMMLKDVLNAHFTNFERDYIATAPHVVSALPYSSPHLVAHALSLPVHEKIDLRSGSRKKILRKAALRAGLPEAMAMREKRAVQYSSGIGKLVSSLARV